MTGTDTLPLLARARAAIPGYDATEAALAEVAERLRQSRAAPTPESSVAVLADLGASEPLPDDLGEQVLKIRQRNGLAIAGVQVADQQEHRDDSRDDPGTIGPATASPSPQPSRPLHGADQRKPSLTDGRDGRDGPVRAESVCIACGRPNPLNPIAGRCRSCHFASRAAS